MEKPPIICPTCLEVLTGPSMVGAYEHYPTCKFCKFCEKCVRFVPVEKPQEPKT